MNFLCHIYMEEDELAIEALILRLFEHQQRVRFVVARYDLEFELRFHM